MNRVASPIAVVLSPAICIFLMGCSKQSERVDLVTMQVNSFYGPTSDWSIEGLPWEHDVQEIRNSAYEYCLAKHPEDYSCPDVQDMSIKYAVDVEIAVQIVIDAPEKSYLLGMGEPLGHTISLEPKRHNEARQYCFSVYEDAGASDARFLGPCLASTVGGDYFGFLPVP